MEPKIIAFDVDATLAEFSKIPGADIQEPRPHSQRVVRYLKDAGHYLLIYSVRTEEFALRDWAEKNYPKCFEGINCNPRDVAKYTIVSAKPLADIYVDDRAYPLCEPLDWLKFEKWCEERGLFNWASWGR